MRFRNCVLVAALFVGSSGSGRAQAQSTPPPVGPTKADLGSPQSACDYEKVLTWFPVAWGNAEQARCFFFGKPEKKASTLDQIRIVGTTDLDLVSAQVEAAADTLGPVRGSLGITLSTGTSTDGEEDADSDEHSLERLVAGGGHGYAQFAYPIALVMSRTKKVDRRGVVYVINRTAFDVPGLGGVRDDVPVSNALVLEAHAVLRSDSGKLGVLGRLDYGAVIGNYHFERKIGRQGGFFLGQWSLGVVLNNLFLFGLQGVWQAPNDLRGRLPRISFGVSIYPGIAK